MSEVSGDVFHMAQKLVEREISFCFYQNKQFFYDFQYIWVYFYP